MINEHDIALMISIAYTAPYIDPRDVTLVSDKVIFKLVDMYSDEVKEYAKLNDVKILQAENLREEAHALCNDTLVYLGVFCGGSIPSHQILALKKLCNRMAVLHTHPVPLPIPTPEDIISMYQIGYRIECILSRMSRSLAKMICIEPLKELEDIMLSMKVFEEKLYSLIDRYVIVEDEYDVRFIPYPSTERLHEIEREFVNVMKDSCRFNIVSFYMDNGEYEYKVV